MDCLTARIGGVDLHLMQRRGVLGWWERGVGEGSITGSWTLHILAEGSDGH